MAKKNGLDLLGWEPLLHVSGETALMHTLQDDIRNAGGRWVDIALVHDQNWVSSRFPKDLEVFNEGMLILFSEYQEINEEERAA